MSLEDPMRISPYQEGKKRKKKALKILRNHTQKNQRNPPAYSLILVLSVIHRDNH